MKKKILTLLGSIAFAVMAYAQESSDISQIPATGDFTSAKDGASSIAKGLIQLVSDVTPFVVNVMLAVLAVAAIVVVARWIISAFRRR